AVAPRWGLRRTFRLAALPVQPECLMRDWLGALPQDLRRRQCIATRWRAVSCEIVDPFRTWESLLLRFLSRQCFKRDEITGRSLRTDDGTRISDEELMTKDAVDSHGIFTTVTFQNSFIGTQ